LEPSDIAKDAVTLSWYEPDDDGGSPITGYWVERYEPDHDKWIRCNKLPIRDTNFRYVWMSFHPSMPLLFVINFFVCMSEIQICLQGKRPAHKKEVQVPCFGRESCWAWQTKQRDRPDFD